MNPSISMIAVTGGPCGGKSTLLARVHRWFEEHDFDVIVISETATELITAGLSPGNLGNRIFQEELLTYSLRREEHYRTMARYLKGGRKAVVLCDRGILDADAYLQEGEFKEILEKFGYKFHDLLNRYKMVVHLVTAANGAEEFYTLSNNTARSESPEKARELDKRTQMAWMGHPHHYIIDNSTNFETKMKRALAAFARTLDMPEPTETERKFKLLNYNPAFLPQDCVSIEITQDYLKTNGVMERRVRQYSFKDGASFYYTEKIPTTDPATRIEREREIDNEEYLRLLEEKDVALQTIKKTRHCFSFGGRRFELDVYRSGRAAKDNLVILEIEIQNINEEIAIPSEWIVEEVTGDPLYANRSLAAA